MDIELMAANIKRVRGFKMITQRHLAKLARLDIETIRRLERGEWGQDARLIQLVAQALNVPVVDLLNSKTLILKELDKLMNRRAARQD